MHSALNRTTPVVLAALALLAVPTASAQRPPLVGTVNPRAVAPPVQQPAPIGGIRTTPIGTPAPVARDLRRPHYRYPGGFIPLRVIDAPVLRGGAVVVYDDTRDIGPRWFPTADQPKWRVDSLAPRVDAWRDIIVEDAICTDTGVCMERVTRMRARWSAYCNCYRFADAMGRVWRVE
jgi:hypothetical protein